MKFNLSKVEYSHNDIKLGIKVPKYLTEDLAHFIGIHLGDGYLSDPVKHGYRMSYNGHMINEKEWYENYLKNLISRLFNKKVNVSKDNTTIKISFGSKCIHTFLNNVCGLPSGPKVGCDIPKIIKDSGKEIKSRFLMGFADTDFSLVFKNRHKKINYYPVIDHGTSNKLLNNSLIKILEEDFGFSVHHGQRERKHKEAYYFNSYFQINGIKAFKKWMDTIGFTNQNQLTKYSIWKKFGHLPPKTNIVQRKDILNGLLDIDSCYELKERRLRKAAF